MATVKLLLMNCARRAPEARVAGLRGDRMPGNKAASVRNALMFAGTGLSARVPAGKRVMRKAEPNARLLEKIPRAAVVRSLRKTNNLSLH